MNPTLKVEGDDRFSSNLGVKKNSRDNNVFYKKSPHNICGSKSIHEIYSKTKNNIKFLNILLKL